MTTDTNSFGDNVESFFFDALRSKYVTNDRSADVERVTDDRNIPDRVDVAYGENTVKNSAQSFGLQNNKGLIAGVAIAGAAILFAILRKKGK